MRELVSVMISVWKAPGWKSSDASAQFEDVLRFGFLGLGLGFCFHESFGQWFGTGFDDVGGLGEVPVDGLGVAGGRDIRVLAVVYYQRHLGRSAGTGAFFEPEQFAFDAMAFAAEVSVAGVEAVHGAAGYGDFLLGFEVEFGLVAAVRRILGYTGQRVVEVTVFGGLQAFGFPEDADEFFDELFVVEALGLPIMVHLGLDFGEFFVGFAGHHAVANGIEAVFEAGGLRTVHSLGRFRARGFSAVDPGGFGARFGRVK